MEQNSFWKQIQIPNSFGIPNLGSKHDLNLVWIFKGVQPLGTNLNNSPKFSLGSVFMNVDLYGITYMQKFEDPILVAFGPNLIIEQWFEFEFEMHTSICAVPTVTLGLSQPTALKKSRPEILKGEWFKSNRKTVVTYLIVEASSLDGENKRSPHFPTCLLL
jgi:hypothetical protein